MTARHRTRRTPRERVTSVLRWAGRAALWLALGAAVGVAAWAALGWVGSDPSVARWVGLATGAIAAAAAAVASTVPGPTAPPDDPEDGPSAS